MKLSHTRVLAAPRERVFELLTDAAAMTEGLDGLESLEPAGPDAWDVVVKAGFSRIKGRVRIEDRKPPTSFALAVDAKGMAGRLRGLARIRLSARGGGTEVACDGEAEVGGLIAMAGPRRTEAAANRKLAEFFDALDARLRA
jgi:uncharacterized protein